MWYNSSYKGVSYMSEIKELKNSIIPFNVAYFRDVVWLAERTPLFDWCIKHQDKLKMCDIEIEFKGESEGFKPRLDFDRYLDCYLLYNKHERNLVLVSKSRGILRGDHAIEFLEKALKIQNFVTLVLLHRGYQIPLNYPVIGLNLIEDRNLFNKVETLSLCGWYILERRGDSSLSVSRLL